MSTARLLQSSVAQGAVAGVAAVAASVAAGRLHLRLSAEAFAILLPLGYWMLTGGLWAAAYRVGQEQTDATRRWGTMVAAGVMAGAVWLASAAAASTLGTDPFMTLANGGWKPLPVFMAREIVRLLREPAGIYNLGIIPALFVTLLAARHLAPAEGDGRTFRTLAMATGGLVSGLLTKPWLMLLAPNSTHGPHVLGSCIIFVVFGAGLSLGEALAKNLDPPDGHPDGDDVQQGSGGADDSRGS